MIEISEVSLGPEVEASVLACLRAGRLSAGANVAALEDEFAAACGVRHAVAVASGTVALEAALSAHGIGPGDEVIVPALTFVASAHAVLAVGAEVRVVDVGDDFCLDPDAVAAAVTPRTAAVMPVHLYGRPAAMDALLDVARRYDLAVVEDAAQAHGATHRGRPVGSFGTGCFSFYATKNLAAGEGGMVTTDDDAVADRLRLLRNQGMRERYVHEVVGHNWRMTELAAAVVLPQLRTYPRQLARRRANAARLSAGLAGAEGLVLPALAEHQEPVWHQYTVLAADRDGLAERLRARGVGTGVYYPRVLGDHECHRAHPGLRTASDARARAVAASCLSLPVHPAVAGDGIDRVVAAVRAALAPGRPGSSSAGGRPPAAPSRIP